MIDAAYVYLSGHAPNPYIRALASAVRWESLHHITASDREPSAAQMTLRHHMHTYVFDVCRLASMVPFAARVTPHASG